MIHSLQSVLGEHPFLQGLKAHHIELLSGCASNLRFEADSFLCRSGDEADQFYILRSGRVAVEIFAANRGPVTIQTLGEGDILGWSWLVPPYHWRFSARALELTRAIALDGRCLRQKCEQDHELGYELLKRFSHVIAERLDAARLQLLDVYAGDLP
jgi:CRP-like cAMP-binding protein